MHRRVQVEIAWFISLSDARFAEFKPLSPGARTYLLGLVKNFSEADAAAIKEIEKTTNHDVKAVEYWIKSKFEARPELQAASEFVHFACTSEDINNTSHALQLKSSRELVVLPALDKLLAKLREMAHAYADQPMLSRTHGQTASPTTVGKEIANVLVRLQAPRFFTERDEVPMHAPKRGSYSIVILRRVIDGKVQTQVVAGEVYPKPDESVAPNVYKIAAVLDLNGDGKLEVIVQSFYYEGGQTTIYHCEPDKIEAALSVECGA